MSAAIGNHSFSVLASALLVGICLLAGFGAEVIRRLIEPAAVVVDSSVEELRAVHFSLVLDGVGLAV